MSGNRQLSNISTEATEVVNTTGVRTSILDVTPEDGTALILYNMAEGAAGIPLYMDLQDSNGDDLPTGTEFALEFKSNIDDQFSAVSHVLDNIQPWNARGIAEQQNEEYVDSVRVPLKGPRLNVREVDTLRVAIQSSAQIDWSNSALYFDKRHVVETSDGR